MTLDLRASDNMSLLNHLAFPFVAAMATRGDYLSDLSAEAAGAVLKVHYCLDRFQRFAELEIPLVRDTYHPDEGKRQVSTAHLEHVRDAAVAELEGSLKIYAGEALAQLPGPGRARRYMGHGTA